MKRKFNNEKKSRYIKCRFCNKKSKIKKRVNYPFGRNSKPIYRVICRKCGKEQ